MKNQKSKIPATKIGGSAKNFGGKNQNYNSKFKSLSLLTFALNFYLFAFFFCLSHAESISSRELIENARSLDGKTVAYKGEAITAILNRGEYSWVSLNDGDNTIGVWCESSSLASVKFIGSYKYKGDIIEVEGIFNRACPLHGGELDIHASRVELIKSGYQVKERFDERKIRLFITIFAIILFIVIIFRRRI